MMGHEAAVTAVWSQEEAVCKEAKGYYNQPCFLIVFNAN